jgi:hypothetical protein
MATEQTMPNDIAIGLFRTLGAAEDARARLLHEGLPEDLIELGRLARDATIPPQLTSQTMVSFLDWISATISRSATACTSPMARPRSASAAETRTISAWRLQ